MDITLRPMTQEERLYTYTQSSQIGSQTGNIGHLRADTADYAYMLRLNPNRGEYSLYCYCYRRDWLEHHLQESRKGIRFVDQDYNELFRLRDGAKIRVTFPNGEIGERLVRYIDSTHFEYGFGALSVLHTMQFAEWMAEANAVVEPVNEADIVLAQQKNRTDRGR